MAWQPPVLLFLFPSLGRPRLRTTQKNEHLGVPKFLAPSLFCSPHRCPRRMSTMSESANSSWVANSTARNVPASAKERLDKWRTILYTEEANLDELEDDPEASTQAIAQAQVRVAQARWKLAEAEFRYTEETVPSNQQLALAAFKKAQAKVDKLRAEKAPAAEIASAEWEKAQAKVDKLRAEKAPAAEIASAEWEKAQAKVDKLRAEKAPATKIAESKEYAKFWMEAFQKSQMQPGDILVLNAVGVPYYQ
jgi:hypothetical protein